MFQYFKNIFWKQQSKTEYVKLTKPHYEQLLEHGLCDVINDEVTWYLKLLLVYFPEVLVNLITDYLTLNVSIPEVCNELIRTDMKVDYPETFIGVHNNELYFMTSRNRECFYKFNLQKNCISKQSNLSLNDIRTLWILQIRIYQNIMYVMDVDLDLYSHEFPSGTFIKKQDFSYLRKHNTQLHNIFFEVLKSQIYILACYTNQTVSICVVDLITNIKLYESEYYSHYALTNKYFIVYSRDKICICENFVTKKVLTLNTDRIISSVFLHNNELHIMTFLYTKVHENKHNVKTIKNLVRENRIIYNIDTQMFCNYRTTYLSGLDHDKHTYSSIPSTELYLYNVINTNKLICNVVKFTNKTKCLIQDDDLFI